jgi:hypothetical protein
MIVSRVDAQTLRCIVFGIHAEANELKLLAEGARALLNINQAARQARADGRARRVKKVGDPNLPDQVG